MVGKTRRRREKPLVVLEGLGRLGKWLRDYENLLVSVKVDKELKKWLPSNFVDCKIFYKYRCKLNCKLTCKLTIMARPRLNRNGLWARIFGKIFGKIVGESQKLKKLQKFLGKFSKKIAENSKKIVENSKKILKNL